ncbi:MAG: TonB-dependent receptor, partial [Luminiphilus sp.]|nr:TonB-dependent receptor [Luminiphilus sp.]
YNEETKYMTYRWRDFPAGGVEAYIGAAIGDSITNALTISGTEAFVRSQFPAGTPEEIVQAQVDGAVASLTLQNTPRSLTFGYVGDLDGIGNIPETPGVYGNYNEQEFSNTSGRLVAEYSLDDNTNFYASYTTGYRAGGFNGGAFNRDTGTGDDFSEETIASFEVGVKSTLADGRLRINGAYYTYDYDDVQVSVVKTDSGSISTDVVNAAKFSTEGLELDVAWLATDTLQLRAQYAYTNRDFDDYPIYLGLNIPPSQGLTPDNEYNLIMDWALLNAGGNSLDFQLSAAYKDETVSINTVPGNYGSGTNPVPVNLDQATNQERTLVNARLTFSRELEDSRSVSLALWGRNITDEEYRTFGYNYGPSLGYAVHQWGNPATYGLDIRLDL